MNILKKYLPLLLIAVFLSPLLNAQTHIFHGTAEENKAESMIKYENHFYITGTTRRSPASSADYYVLQLNENGSLENEFVFGETHRDSGNDIIVDENGIYIFGYTWTGGYPNNDMLLSKLDFNGKRLWKKYYGTDKNDQGHKFIKTQDGGFAMIGFNRQVDDFGNVYIVRTDEKGEILWENHFGDRFIDHGFSIVENQNGEFVIAGTKGGFYNPTSTDFLNPDADIYIIKTDSQGQEIWQKTFGGTYHDWGKKIIPAPGGGYYICGSTQSEGAGSFDMFLMKINETGDQLWFKTFGGSDWEYGENVQLSSDNHLYLLASSASYSDNYKPDHLLVKTNLEGEIIWLNTYGGIGSDYSSGLVCTSDSGCAFTGWTNAGSIGKEDIVFYKISKTGEPQVLSYIEPINDSIEQIIIFPNPAKDQFSVLINANVDSTFELKLFNLNGRLVYKKKVKPNVLHTHARKLPAGNYLVTIQNKQFSYSSKLLVY